MVSVFVFMGKKERASRRDLRRGKTSMEQNSVNQKKTQGNRAKCPHLTTKQKEYNEPFWAKKGPSGYHEKTPVQLP